MHVGGEWRGQLAEVFSTREHNEHEEHTQHTAREATCNQAFVNAPFLGHEHFIHKA